MKIIAILILALSVSAAHAGQQFRCSTMPKPGTAILDIQHQFPPAGRVDIKWYIGDSSSSLLGGSFSVEFDSENGGNSLTGKGTLGGSEAWIQTVQEPPGYTVFSISSKDKRIDRGYGLFLNCKKIQH